LCPNCGKSHHNIPDEIVNAALISSSILSFMCILNTWFHLTIRKLRDFFSLTFPLSGSFSIGYIINRLKYAGEALRPIYLELLDNIKYQPVINADESVHRIFGKKSYAWAFTTEKIVAFKIGTRSFHVLETVLGENYVGFIGSDCYNCYLKYVNENIGAKHQLCLAHLIREFSACGLSLNPAAVA
jgi:hypothetical protein